MSIVRTSTVALCATAAAVVLFTVPGEPATWALMIAGLGAVGGALRWRRSMPAAA